MPFTKSETKTRRVLFCCAGYMSVHSKRNRHIAVKSDAECAPFCQPSCPANSFCRPPPTCECVDHVRPTVTSRCECHEGYLRVDQDQCIAVCPYHCNNGNCSGDKCTCNEGYTKNHLQRCVPQCVKGCGGDEECTDPGVCTSKACEKPGFVRNDMGECVPKCTNGCENGECATPENCTCNDGYEMNAVSKICQAKCDNCTNGVCVLPAKCDCNAGFEDVEGFCVDKGVVVSDEMSMDSYGTDTVWLLLGISSGLAVVAAVAGWAYYARKRSLAASKSNIEAPIELQRGQRPMLAIPEAAEVEENEVDKENDLYGKF